MKIKPKIYLTVLLWIGLPLVLLTYIYANSTSSSSAKPAVLFVMYSGFSWSIALLAFVMETSRQRLFRPIKPVHSALRLGVYATLAVLLALFTSPQQGMFSSTEKMIVIMLAFLYGGMMGYIYHHNTHSNKG